MTRTTHDPDETAVASTNDGDETGTAPPDDTAGAEPELEPGSAPGDESGPEPTTGDARRSARGSDVPELPFETTPALKPTMLLVALTVTVGAVAVGYLVANPTAVAGDPGLTELVWNAVGVLVVLLLARFVLRLYLLSRTTYVVESDSLRREFSLLYRQESREVPLSQLRGHEFSQSRVQRLLGFGTVRVLTGGTNRSLGYVEFEDLPRPARVRDLLRSLVDRRDGRPTAGDAGDSGSRR